jgi:hypothetical protein
MTDTQTVQITLTIAEAVWLINLIGDRPTNEAVYPLWQKLREQVEPTLELPATP